MKNLKAIIKNNIISIIALTAVLGGGTALAANLNSSNTQDTNVILQESTQYETQIPTIGESVTEATTVEEETTIATSSENVVEIQQPRTEPVTEPTIPKTIEEKNTTVEGPQVVLSAEPEVLNFTKLNDGYELSSVSTFGKVSNILQVPNTYNGLPVTSISPMIFDGFYYETIIIPASVTSFETGFIGFEYRCPNLKYIICLGSEPLKLRSLIFNKDMPNLKYTVFVPDNSVSLYKDKWSSIFLNEQPIINMIKPLSELDSSISKQIAY